MGKGPIKQPLHPNYPRDDTFIMEYPRDWGQNKVGVLRKFIHKHQPCFFFIQESKSINTKLINSVWNDAQVQWSFSPSMGNSGGLISLWNADFFTINNSHSERHWIAINGIIKHLHFHCNLINIYNPCSAAERALVWDSLTNY